MKWGYSLVMLASNLVTSDCTMDSLDCNSAMSVSSLVMSVNIQGHQVNNLESILEMHLQDSEAGSEDFVECPRDQEMA